MASGWNGYDLLGSISSSQQINFWIMNSAQWSQWSKGQTVQRSHAGCSSLYGQGVVSQGRINQWSFDWVIPDRDTYYFVFLNTGQGTANISFNLSFRIMSTATSEYATPTTSYNYYTPTSTPTSYSSSASQPPPPQGPNWFNFNSLVAYLVFLVAVGAVAIFMIWNHGRPSRRSRTTLLTDYVTSKPASKTAPRKAETAPKTEKSQPQKAFCINCGEELPADWKFCRHCGTKQP